MLSHFIKYIEENKICTSDDRILLAVSGGIDSMVMTNLFISTGFESGIAHCNFSLRGFESDKDEELVRKTASGYKIPFYSIRFDTKEYAGKKGISIQMAARELRYKWFEEIRSENHYDFIAIAHNLNDNIETVLLNLVRGTGITGLTGMKPVNNKIIRPLLFASRDMISDYRNRYGIPFREDKSNADTKYHRNKIRHLVLPVLKEINPSLESTLNETAERMAGINEIVADYVNILNLKSRSGDGKTLKYKITGLKQHVRNKALLYELFKPYGITSSTAADLIRVIEGRTGGNIATPAYRLFKNRNDLVIYPNANPEKIYCEINNNNELEKVPGIVSAKTIKVTGDFVIEDKKSVANIDFRKITFPLVIRRWEKGDHFIPLGMNKNKKLSDYFIDRKYSLIEKEEALILESAGNIIWIIGERIDDRYKITPSTIEVLRIESGFKDTPSEGNI
jgi:tRNA(Ile)-lysidine synthase